MGIGAGAGTYGMMFRNFDLKKYHSGTSLGNVKLQA